MRIVHLADYGGPYPGSFVAMIRAVDEAAAKRGWSFEAVFTPVAATRSWYAELAADGVATRIAPDVRRRPLSAWLTDVVAEGHQRTVLHTHFTSFDLPALAAARGRVEVAVMWHLHTRLEPGPSAAVRNALKFTVFGRRVDAILCVSPDMGEVALRRHAPADRVVVFPNAIDLSRFQPAADSQERERARARLGVPAGQPLLVHFGWDWERKGGDLFLATIDTLVRSGVAVQGLSVGGGEPARAGVAEVGLSEHVRILEPQDDVRALYAAADVFVSPSTAEGMPYAVLEALCTGTPAVISDIPSHTPLAEQTPGCVLAERNPQALAEVIQSVLSARAEGTLWVDVSRLAASLDPRDWAERLLDLYSERLST
jgi:teichuronic acid biosynthesis glycosyltransferase TuaC